ncbi:hypothetical protein [Calycomorphotria hydatis]|uniref:Uncharacterized protein n=1 Tax=Calycomorphotria hydatis TaxID=2528027 RepID=A0A517TBK1_9PLAN|nr:hypothetical protein [Calycomorphotria hydatis]QDT65754.1 hypothetical protein V22_30150 [Calycomorphotria hydatis]
MSEIDDPQHPQWNRVTWFGSVMGYCMWMFIVTGALMAVQELWQATVVFFIGLLCVAVSGELWRQRQKLPLSTGVARLNAAATLGALGITFVCWNAVIVGPALRWYFLGATILLPILGYAGYRQLRTAERIERELQSRATAHKSNGHPVID